LLGHGKRSKRSRADPLERRSTESGLTTQRCDAKLRAWPPASLSMLSHAARALPLADPAASALARLADRGDYTDRHEYVFCSRLGRRLDPSAVRRRYKSARDAVGLRPLRFHALRHAAGPLIAREAGAHFVQAFLGHSRLSTTERYLHAKSRPHDVDVLNRAFAGAAAAAVAEPD
jgi:integrase